jgi:hypothetical protein
MTTTMELDPARWTQGLEPRAVCGGCGGAGYYYPVGTRPWRAQRVLCASCKRSDLECGCPFAQTLFERTPLHEPDSIEARFRKFHLDNPHVYTKLCELAREARRAGHGKIGIGMLWEVLRWQTFIATRSGEPFKLNDHFPSRYARLIMDLESDLEGVFNTRELRTP